MVEIDLRSKRQFGGCRGLVPQVNEHDFIRVSLRFDCGTILNALVAECLKDHCPLVAFGVCSWKFEI